MNSVKKLLQFNFDVDNFVQRAFKPISIPAERFDVLKEIMDNDKNNGNGPDLETIREIYRLFLDTPTSNLLNVFNTLRRIRLLAWALTFSEDGQPRIVDLSRLKEALQLIENRFRINTLRGVFITLLQAWDSSNANILRAFVKKHLINYDGKQKFFQKLKSNMSWYCEKSGTKQLAETLLRSQVKLSDVWSFLDSSNNDNSNKENIMYRYSYFGFVAIEYINNYNPPEKTFVEDVVEFVKKYNNDTKNRAILSNLIELLGNDASEDLRQPIQSYVLQEWKDPRITGSNWRDVSAKAKEIFTRWITKEDLRFFFDVVAQACNDQNFEYRREFWLAYLEHISFCRPVLRKNLEAIFRHDPQIMQYYRDRHPATLKGGSSDQHAFIIQIGNYTFVEFSTAGACYVYYNVDLPFESGKLAYNMRELRNKNWAEHRIIHQNSENYYWQNNLAKWIKINFDIEPQRSYRLHGNNNIDSKHSVENIEKTHLNCPNLSCRQTLQIPVRTETLRITCPTCKTSFQH